jgi:hypothetical protein
LATRGAEILEEYFPGLDAELAAAGCPLLDQTYDAITDTPAGRLPRFRSGLSMRAVSRTLLEERVRRRLESDPKFEFLAEREVVGLVPGAGGSVAGARTRERNGKVRDGSRKPVETLAADLIVDASGQSSRAPRWLEELGYRAPEEEVVDARLGYATRWFAVPKSFSEDWKGIAVLPGWPDTPAVVRSAKWRARCGRWAWWASAATTRRRTARRFSSSPAPYRAPPSTTR